MCRPPSKKVEWETQFHECIDYLQTLNLPICLTGDFKINLLKNAAFADEMEATYCLKQIIKEPTRITQKTRSLIDHIYISHDIAATHYGTFNRHISDHLATYLQFSGSNKPNKSSAVHVPATMYHNTKHLNVDKHVD